MKKPRPESRARAGGAAKEAPDKPGSGAFSIAGVITEAGSAAKNRTGEWRTFRPLVDLAKCTGCGICIKFCPDNALRLVDTPDGKKIVVDYEHCKGCMICLAECPFKAYASERESRAGAGAK